MMRDTAAAPDTVAGCAHRVAGLILRLQRDGYTRPVRRRQLQQLQRNELLPLPCWLRLRDAGHHLLGHAWRRVPGGHFQRGGRLLLLDVRGGHLLRGRGRHLHTLPRRLFLPRRLHRPHSLPRRLLQQRQHVQLLRLPHGHVLP